MLKPAHKLRFSHYAVNITKSMESEIQSLTLCILSTENHLNQSQWVDHWTNHPKFIDCVMVQQTVFDSSPLAYQDGSNMEKDNRDSLFKIAHPPKIMLKFFKSIKAEAFLLTFGFSDKTLHSLNTWKAILHFLVQ